ncbi:cyanophycinase [Fulvivirga sp. RKSG066]|nr:cyanophycinase [Fulvivirga aurantia]
MACTEDVNITPQNDSIESIQKESKNASSTRISSASIGIIGDQNDVSASTTGGTVLMGGGPDVDEAIEWMINKSGGGDFVVIRATGTDAYNSYIYNLGNVNSVETLLINSRSKANDSDVEATIRNAEALFIAGGDQYDYVSYWKDTKVESAINYLRNTKGAPIGGTSAGNAIMGEVYFDAANGTVYSDEALDDPYNQYMSLQRSNFIDNPYLENTVTDTHYDDPDRRGRHVTFMARMNKDWGMTAKGIGVDEATAVCIESNGKARVYGSGYAFFLKQNGSGPELCVPGSKLDWYRSRQAVKVYKIRGNNSGNRYFWLTSWNSGSGGSWQYYYVDRGRFRTSR